MNRKKIIPNFSSEVGLCAVLLLGSLMSCSVISGGPCSYDVSRVKAIVTRLEFPGDGSCIVYYQTDFAGCPPAGFDPRKAPLVIEPKGGRPLDASLLNAVGIVVGKRFEMDIALIQSGTCTPIVFQNVKLPHVPPDHSRQIEPQYAD